MDTTREDGDSRSPKRQAQAPQDSEPSGSAARTVASLDAAIWTSIIEFLPMPKKIELAQRDDVRITWDALFKHYEAAVSEVVATWKTLLNLRFVTKELATLLHPVDNKALWKKLVLQFFDFSAGDDGFNMENYHDDHGLDIPDDEVDPDESSEEGEDEENNSEAPAATTRSGEDQATVQSEQDPQLVAMRGRYYNQPPNYLEEDLVNWYKLGISHRPSQYGFLKTLQQQPPVGEWPESEDPFTLFGDLVRLLMLPHGDRMGAGGEGGDTTFKFIAAPTEADSSSAYFRFYVMKTLGYAFHFWHWGRGIGNEWKGNTEPAAFDALIKSQIRNKRLGDEDENTEEEIDKEAFDDCADAADFAFPGCSVRLAKRLYCNLRQHCQDWRAVCCNGGADGDMPVFFVGESKALPHRWIGYAGGKCWT